jgi:peptidoglycan/LPS O-acetylase OafA/YrhL
VTVRSTTWRLLLAIAVVAGVLSWAVLYVDDSRYGDVPDVPWPSAAVLAVFGGSILLVALTLRPRLQRREGHRPVDPLVSARFGVLSLACSRAGALFAGVYAGFLAMALADLSVPFRRHLAYVSGACVLAALVLVTGGLVLERVCRLPEPPDEDDTAP